MGGEVVAGLVAHSPGEGGHWHDLLVHLSDVAEMAALFAAPFGGEDAARMVGWWHDAGKAHPSWQQYVQDAYGRPSAPRARVDHSSAGMLALSEERACHVLAFLVAHHHGGLGDFPALKDRLMAKRADPRVMDAVAVAHGLLDGRCPIRPVSLPISLQAPGARGLGLRMLHSCLVDADCLDTERHFTPDAAGERAVSIGVEALWSMLERSQAGLMAGQEGDLNARREAMYRAAVAKAPGRAGFYALTMPTGAGKTRTGMAFALRHALEHGMERVIVAIPYTSIIEQSADVYRGIFGHEAVLEHHSSRTAAGDPDDESTGERWQRLAAQNWDSPVVVTTNVQLFESLFAARNRKIRKLHNVARSVIILDEIQTLPPKLVRPTLDALRALVEHFGCTVVLSTATQPAFKSEVLRLTVMAAHGLNEVEELIEDHAEHFKALERVVYRRIEAPLGWEALAERVCQREQALVILNTVRDTLALLDALGDRPDLLYLSTRLCGVHRREVLAEVGRRLSAGEPCLLVSTQVVEAGVDLDFPVVFRAMGPLEAIVQAAGRCNREGRAAERGEVFVFEAEDGRIPPGVYSAARDLARAMLGEAGVSLHDPTVFGRYFRRLYDAALPERDPIVQAERALMFEQVAREYKLIEDDSVAVLVRRVWASEAELAQIDAAMGAAASGRLTHWDLRSIQPFLVNLRRRDFEAHRQSGLVQAADAEGSLFVWAGGYDALRGLTETLDVDTLIF